MQNNGKVAVISEIAAQKNNRGDKRRNHAVAVRDFVAAFDENKTEREKNRA